MGSYLNNGKPVPKDYIVTARETTLPISLDSVKEQLKIDGTDEDDYLTLLLNSAISIAELFTKRDISSKTYKCFLDSFTRTYGFELRKSPLTSLDAVRYYKDNTLTTLDSSEYYLTESPNFRSLFPVDSWPCDSDTRAQAVEIEFRSGYTETTLPADLEVAILQHITALYENRGDCSNKNQCICLLPSAAKLAYQMNRISDLRVFP